MRDRDNITRTDAKDPWSREAGPLAQRPVEARTGVDTEPCQRSAAEAGEGWSKLPLGAGMRGARLTASGGRQAPSDRLALKPYRGKPAVRNFRGDDENVGIIRSPVRASVLLDHAFQRNIPGRPLTPRSWIVRLTYACPRLLLPGVRFTRTRLPPAGRHGRAGIARLVRGLRSLLCMNVRDRAERPQQRASRLRLSGLTGASSVP
jgi:hypothetical protein